MIELKPGELNGLSIEAEGCDYVDIWYTPIGVVDEQVQKACHAALNSDERARLSRFKAPDAQRQFLVGRALLRRTLSTYFHCSADAWVFEVNAYGKPFVVAPSVGRRLSFNVSHTQGMAACVVSRTATVGVDVEFLGRSVDVEQLAPIVLTETELDTLGHAPAQERRRVFLRLWTLKEALVKAMGEGLSVPLKQFAFSIDGEAPAVRLTEAIGIDSCRWRFALRELNGLHQVAVAVRAASDASSLSLVFREVSLAQLAQDLAGAPGGDDDRVRRVPL